MHSVLHLILLYINVNETAVNMFLLNYSPTPSTIHVNLDDFEQLPLLLFKYVIIFVGKKLKTNYILWKYIIAVIYCFVFCAHCRIIIWISYFIFNVSISNVFNTYYYYYVYITTGLESKRRHDVYFIKLLFY